jgi:hypothetical protein
MSSRFAYPPVDNTYLSSDHHKKIDNRRNLGAIPHYTNDDELYDSEPNYIDKSRSDNDDKYYNTDPNYNISQEWLLFQRQGDQYDNLDEWNTTPESSHKEAFNEEGFSTLNTGLVWGDLPGEKSNTKILNPENNRMRSNISSNQSTNDEYQRLLDYYHREMDEDD